jgi:hypothetical protein
MNLKSYKSIENMNLYIISMQRVKYPGLINYYLAKPVAEPTNFGAGQAAK